MCVLFACQVRVLSGIDAQVLRLLHLSSAPSVCALGPSQRWRVWCVACVPSMLHHSSVAVSLSLCLSLSLSPSLSLSLSLSLPLSLSMPLPLSQSLSLSLRVCGRAMPRVRLRVYSACACKLEWHACAPSHMRKLADTNRPVFNVCVRLYLSLSMRLCFCLSVCVRGMRAGTCSCPRRRRA